MVFVGPDEGMNRGLLVFSILLIIVGLFIGIYLIPLVGFFLLIIAVLAKSPSPTPMPTPEPKREEPSYSTKNSTPVAEPPGMMKPTPMSPPMGAPPQALSGYEQRTMAGSPALFPTTMFPSFTQSQPVMGQVVEEKKEEHKRESRDDLIELVALLAILRLASS